jgi:hypothetical protein
MRWSRASRPAKSSDVTRWLRADAPDVVRIAPTGATLHPGTAPSSPGSLGEGLERWRVSLSRVRLVALARRQLLVAGAVAVVVELILVAVGTGRTTRVIWLAVPAVVAAAGIGAGLRRRLATPDVARLLDHDLSLAERVSTAVEVGARSRPLAGLPAVVVSQAGDAVAASLAGARAVFRPARAEWLGLLGVAAVVIGLVAVPSTASAPARLSAATAPHHLRRSGAGSAHAPTPAHTGRPPSTHGSSTAGGSRRPPPLSFGNGEAPSGAGRELARGPSGGKPSNNAPSNRISQGGNGEVAPKTGAGAGQSGSSATAGSKSSAGGQATNQGGSAKGGAGSSAASGAHPGAGRAATGAKAGKVGSGNAPGGSGASARSSGSPGAFKGQHSPPGGDTAGHSRGTTTGAARASAPKTATSSGGLPIQSGYTPSTKQTGGRQGTGPAVSGGSGRARSGAATGGGTTGSGSFPFIAPTPNSLGGGDESLLLDYFGPFSAQLLNTW